MLPRVLTNLRTEPGRWVAGILGMLLLLAACSQGDDQRLVQVRTLQGSARFGESVEPLREILAADPENPEANYRLGVALLQTVQASLAVWPLSKAAASREYAVDAGSVLAALFLRTRNFEEAVRAADRVLEIHPAHLATRQLHAAASLNSGQPEETLADARAILAMQPEKIHAALLLAQALAALERYDEAEEAYDQLVKLSETATRQDIAAEACLARAKFYDEDREDPERARGGVRRLRGAVPDTPAPSASGKHVLR